MGGLWSRFWSGELVRESEPAPLPVRVVPRSAAPAAAQPESFDLAVARDRVALPATLANPVEMIEVLVFPPGGVANLHLSHGGVPIPLTMQGQVREPDPPCAEGIFLSNPAGAGTLVLLVSYAKP